MNQTIRAIAVWVLIVLSGVLMWKVVQSGGAGAKVPEISFSNFMQSVDRGDVAEVVIRGTADVAGKFKNGNSGFHTTIPSNYPAIFDHLRDHNVTVMVRETGTNNWPNYLLNLSPLILFGALWFVMIRGIQRSSRKKVKHTYEAVSAADVPKALEKANELSQEGWRAVSISFVDSPSSKVVVLMEK